MSGQKLAEKELLNSLKPPTQTAEDPKPGPPELREKLDRLKSTNSPGPTPGHESLQQKLDRLKQKQADPPTPLAEPKQQDNDNDYSPF